MKIFTKSLMVSILCLYFGMANASQNHYESAGQCAGAITYGLKENILFNQYSQAAQNGFMKYRPYFVKLNKCHNLKEKDDVIRQCVINLNDKNALYYHDGFLLGLKIASTKGVELKLYTDLLCSTLK